MDTLISFIQEKAHLAHWFIFGGILLAGLNIPISIDLMMLVSATLAATIIPENTIHLFLSTFLGCVFAAWISYWVGRKLGPKLRRFSFFSSLLSDERIEKIKKFYQKYGLLTLIVGRFIPFGVRNGIFMSSGLSQVSFPQFMLRDVIACAIWCSVCFGLFYLLGKNLESLYTQVKSIHLYIFLAFKVAIIGFICYKKIKKSRSKINV